MLAAAVVTAIATAVLAVFAIVTAIFAIKAFGKQSQEVSDQASMLQVQSGQLDAQREQLADQQKLNARQTEVLELQARELNESLEERKRQADEQRRAQAERVDVTWNDIDDDPGSSMVVVINESHRPIRSVTCVVYPEASDLTMPPAAWEELYPPTDERDGWTFRGHESTGHPVIYALRAGGRAGFKFPLEQAGANGSRGAVQR